MYWLRALSVSGIDNCSFSYLFAILVILKVYFRYKYRENKNLESLMLVVVSTLLITQLNTRFHRAKYLVNIADTGLDTIAMFYCKIL